MGGQGYTVSQSVSAELFVPGYCYTVRAQMKRTETNPSRPSNTRRFCPNILVTAEESGAETVGQKQWADGPEAGAEGGSPGNNESYSVPVSCNQSVS